MHTRTHMLYMWHCSVQLLGQPVTNENTCTSFVFKFGISIKWAQPWILANAEGSMHVDEWSSCKRFLCIHVHVHVHVHVCSLLYSTVCTCTHVHCVHTTVHVVWSVVAERSSLPDSSSGVSSRMWVWIPAVTLVSLSKTLNHNCFSPPRG